MPTMEDLVRKNKKRVDKIKKGEHPRDSAKRIQRTGATRPWQEFLPQYKNDESATAKSELRRVDKATVHAQGSDQPGTTHPPGSFENVQANRQQSDRPDEPEEQDQRIIRRRSLSESRREQVHDERPDN